MRDRLRYQLINSGLLLSGRKPLHSPRHRCQVAINIINNIINIIFNITNDIINIIFNIINSINCNITDTNDLSISLMLTVTLQLQRLIARLKISLLLADMYIQFYWIWNMYFHQYWISISKRSIIIFPTHQELFADEQGPGPNGQDCRLWWFFSYCYEPCNQEKS